jgi:hypothetical protein
MKIYDDRGKSDEELSVVQILGECNGYLFVVLENHEVGLINKDEMTYISDQREFYMVDTLDF